MSPPSRRPQPDLPPPPIALAGVPRCRLGESPAWDPIARLLSWVDVHGQAVHRLDPASGRCVTTELAERVGAAVPHARGGLVLAVPSGFLRLNSTGTIARLAEIEPLPPRTRMNDGKCDARGRLWAGTMSEVDAPTAALYCLSPGGTVRRAFGNVIVSNGLGWSPDNSAMYYIDSGHGRIDTIEFDLDSGQLGERRTLVEIPASAGVPDGLAVDAQGCIWVALFGGGALRRYRPDGRLAEALRVPASLVTSCAFAGAALDELYITSAAHMLKRAEPWAGALFRWRAPTPGLPVGMFGG